MGEPTLLEKAMKPSEMTTVELLRETAAYLRDEHGHFDAADALDERAKRLGGWLATMDAGEPLTEAGKDRRYVLESLNAPSALPGGQVAGMEQADSVPLPLIKPPVLGAAHPWCGTTNGMHQEPRWHGYIGTVPHYFCTAACRDAGRHLPSSPGPTGGVKGTP